MNRLILALTVALASATSAAALPVATLTTAKGSVLVNQGKQFISAQPGQFLTAGDRVMLMQGASATLRFADGCIKNLDSGSLLLVQSTCASSSLSQVASLSAQAVGDNDERDCDDDGIPDSKDSDIDGDDVLNADDKYESCKAGAILTNNTGIWIVAGLAVAGAAVLISDGDDATISP